MRRDFWIPFALALVLGNAVIFAGRALGWSSDLKTLLVLAIIGLGTLLRTEMGFRYEARHRPVTHD